MSFPLLLTIGLTIVFAAGAAGFTARSRSARPLVMGIGLAAIPVGLFLTGVTDLTINGIASLVAWFQRTEFTTLTAWGIGLAVGGLALAIGGSFLPKASRAAATPSAPQQPAVPGQAQRQVAAPPAPAAAQAQPRPKQAPAQKGLDPEDAEIEAMLRKRGIM